MVDKTKEERVREGMTILRQLAEVGVEDTNPGVHAIKDAVRAWIADGRPVILKKVDFGRIDRVGSLLLPQRAGVQPTLTLKVHA
jgi:hypothetical protein